MSLNIQALIWLSVHFVIPEREEILARCDMGKVQSQTQAILVRIHCSGDPQDLLVLPTIILSLSLSD